MTPKSNTDHASGGVYETGIVEAPARNCFAVLVDNEPGVLARVIGLFSGRGYNIESLTVDEVDRENKLSRITIVTSGPPMIINQIRAQLGRLVPVRQVVNLTEQGKFIECSLALVKIVGDTKKRAEAMRIAKEFGARTLDEAGSSVVFELTGTIDEIDRFIAQLRPLGLAEIARTGSTAIACGEAALGQMSEDRRRITGNN